MFTELTGSPPLTESAPAAAAVRVADSPHQTILDEAAVIREITRRCRAGETPTAELLDQLDLAAAQIRLYVHRAHAAAAKG